MSNFSGVITALVTPFRDGQVDLSSFQSVVEHQLASGVSGFVINGTTGESPTLEKEEVKSLFHKAKEIVGDKMPLILGTGSNNTKKTIEATKWAGEIGADAALVVTPYYNKPPQHALVKHFQAVADESPLPVLLYNVPGRTVISMSEETITALSQHPKIVGIKEASGDVSRVQSLRDSCGNDFLLTSGDDDSCIRFMLEGGEGVISVVSHVIPEELSQLCKEACQGNSQAQEKFKRYENLCSLMGVEANPIPVKMALYKMGLLQSPELRLPLVELTPENTEKLTDELKSLGII